MQASKYTKPFKNVKVLPQHWKNQRIKPNLKTGANNNHIEFNKEIERFREKV
ncbi:hypothetical protein [Flagellimonas beolgyonensis]|uniref:hypothetical protein n=1 Tax=Flagellimonas beolgyonensis TaxID=864064 RepID=UPI0013DEBD61|nr:hypothetical protein [Allomuricauda beolgyonensis]